MDDLIGQGYLGVEIAIRTFDHRPGVPFYAYAKTCIRTEIKKLIYKHGYCLSCGRYNRTYPRLEAASGLSESRDPELMVIAEDGELSDPVQATMAKENSEKIAEAVASLPRKSRIAIESMIGKPKGRKNSVNRDAIEALGITRQQISKYRTDGIKMLRIRLGYLNERA